MSSSNNNNSQNLKKRRRQICLKCNRPTPTTCICSSLPNPSLTLSKCRIIVLQHPHEQKRKNRSLPLVGLCFNSSCSGVNNDTDNNGGSTTDTSSSCSSPNNDNGSNTTSNSSTDTQLQDFNCIIARRLGDQVDTKLMNLIHDSNYNLLLVYPTNDSISLKDAIDMIENNKKKQRNENQHKVINSNQISYNDKKDNKNNNDKKYILFFIDATWKYANEMLQTGIKLNLWPSHTIYVKLTPDDLQSNELQFQPRRFDIRTPPSLDQLSTAECIAHCLRIVESRNDIFNILMKPLDLMVQQWHSFFEKVTERDTSKMKKESESKGIM